MFAKRDTRKVAEILYDAADARTTLALARREAEFVGTTAILLDAAHGPQLAATRYLSLYGNKLTKLVHVSTLVKHSKELEELDVRAAAPRFFATRAGGRCWRHRRRRRLCRSPTKPLPT